MKRQKHSLSHTKLLTCNMGQIIPVGCLEVLPGDTFQHSTSALLRVSPLVTPVMHPVQVRIHHFYVPTRILWNGFEDFITGGPDGKNTATPPVTNIGANTASVMNYLGLPPLTKTVCALPLRAYNKIFNEYYRDQDLTDEVQDDSNAIQNCAWEKDYFSSARPWAQKGDGISVPIGGITKIESDGTPVTFTNINNSQPELEMWTDSQGNINTPDNPLSSTQVYWKNSGLQSDLGEAGSLDLADMRRAFGEQRYMEARARYGSRYTEYLRYLGVNPSDARLQRPEFLSGGKTTINFSEVLNTSSAKDNPGSELDDLGHMAGHGIASLRSNRYRKYFEEHGYVMSMLSVRPKAMYTNGINRMFLRKTKEDYFQKELELIGQQEIQNQEVFADASSADEETFGFADRYREYREHPSSVCAEMRSLLDSWHLARSFDTLPVLNDSFVKCVPSKRIHAEQTQHSLWVQVNNSIQARRMVKRNPVARII